MAKRKILIYTQTLFGLGHIVRGVALAEALSPHYEVRIIGGCPPSLNYSSSINYRIVPLPPLRLDLSKKVRHPLDFEEDYSCLISLTPNVSVERAIEERKKRILQTIIEFAPDAIITEYYPFGRWVFGAELLPGIRHARKCGTRILCSVRDILKPLDPQSRWKQSLGEDYEAGYSSYYQRAIRLLNDTYDALLVHSDSRVISLDSSVYGYDLISVPIHYTGYISTSLQVDANDDELYTSTIGEAPYIIMSAGGGYGEFEFFRTWLPTLSHIRDKHLGSGGKIVVLAGPLMDEISYVQLKDVCSLYPRTQIKRYCNGFQHLLDHAALSVSRAGYNTAFNILRSPVPAFLVPSRHLSDQTLRAHRFNALGIARYCDSEASSAVRVECASSAMSEGVKRPLFDTQGGPHTMEIIRQMLS